MDAGGVFFTQRHRVYITPHLFVVVYVYILLFRSHCTPDTKWKHSIIWL